MVVGTCANAETCTDAVGTFSYIFKSVLDTSMRFQALNELGLSFFIYHEQRYIIIAQNTTLVIGTCTNPCNLNNDVGTVTYMLNSVFGTNSHIYEL